MGERKLRFSERQGYREARTAIQFDEIDGQLRTLLFNFVYSLLGELWNSSRGCGNSYGVGENIAREAWCDIFYEPLDKFPYYSSEFFDFIKKKMMGDEWFVVYDLLEFLEKECRSYGIPVAEDLNELLERELSGFRFCDGLLVPITNQSEMSAIQETISLEDKYAGARSHLRSALELLSERESPDYPNVVKEAISAVESVVAVMESHDSRPRFGELVNRLQKEKGLHSALAEAWKKMYGYTCDADGIRHASIDGESRVDFKMAKYMLVSCSAFVNYLVQLDSEESGE